MALVNDMVYVHKKLLEYGPTVYLVYRYKGEIKVKAGKMGLQTFHPYDNPNTWMTTAPTRFMEINNYGRVLCSCEEDIPKAIEMIKQHYFMKTEEVNRIAITSIANNEKVKNQMGYTIT